MKTIKSLRGMKDILNEDAKKFNYFLNKAVKIAKNYGFEYIETPILEETILFKRSVGDSSDIVNKEMYRFIDKGENDVCLRPEGTAGVVRSFIQNKFDRAGGTHRYYYFGPMFRYERPQKGRLREFHQFGCESFAQESVFEDASIIILICKIFDSLNIKYEILLNSLGCQECMPKYKEDLVKKLNTINSSLCQDCNNRIKTNPLRVLDCKNQSCQEAIKDIPKISDSLCSSCKEDFEKLQDILKSNNIKFRVDPFLVRGLDYYTKTAFEFISNDIGSQSAIAGGGRYDKLVEYLGGRKTSAVGFAIGIERLLDLIKLESEKEELIYIGVMVKEALEKAFKLTVKKREKSKVIMEYKPRSFVKHLTLAQKQNATKVMLIGEDELKNNTIWVKDLISKEEKSIKIEI